MSDYYHDDPIEEAPAGRFPSKLIASAVVVIASVFFFQGTLASNISINSGRSIEFGQSVSATAVCSGSENLSISVSMTALLDQVRFPFLLLLLNPRRASPRYITMRDISKEDFKAQEQR